MVWIESFHALHRAALWLRGQPERGTGAPATAAAAAAAHAGTDVDAALVIAFAHPAGGRLGAVVVGEIARRQGRAADEIAQALFPFRGPQRGTPRR
jgi:hypothetical protein